LKTPDEARIVSTPNETKTPGVYVLAWSDGDAQDTFKHESKIKKDEDASGGAKPLGSNNNTWYPGKIAEIINEGEVHIHTHTHTHK
jgi:hypothetical protein